MTIRVARVYDAPGPDDGERVLVDRLWPRGIRKGDARAGRWCKEVAPSTELRRWYNHDVERYDEFVDRYRRELEEPEAAAAFDELRRISRDGTVTLVTATKDLEHSQAEVLAELLDET